MPAPMSSRSVGRLAGMVVAMLVALPAHRAVAQSNKAAAVAAYDEAKRLMAGGKFAEACPKFEASYNADPQLGTLLNLADCHEKIGRIATAWAEYNEVVETAGKRDDPREEYARGRAEFLAPRLSHLVIRGPADPLVGLVVRNDGVDVTALLGNSLPVDPGTHTVTAEATGRESWKASVTIQGERDAEEIAVPALAEAKRDTPHEPDRSRVVIDSSRRTNRRILAAASSGVGLVATGIGLYFGNKAFDDWDASRAPGLCDPENVCSMKGQTLIDSANSAALKANIFVGIGVAGLVAGAVLWFTAPDAERRVEGSQSPVSFAPVISDSSVGGVFSGRF